MRNDFCVFILSNGRPDNIKTLETLQRSGYTGKWYIVIDDEDPTGNQYKSTYGDKVLVFSKAKNPEILLTWIDRFYDPVISAQINYGPIGIAYEEDRQRAIIMRAKMRAEERIAQRYAEEGY